MHKSRNVTCIIISIIAPNIALVVISIIVLNIAPIIIGIIARSIARVITTNTKRARFAVYVHLQILVILSGHDTQWCFYPYDFHFLIVLKQTGGTMEIVMYSLGILIYAESNFCICIVASTMDKEMINILASLAEEPTQPGSQRTASQSIILDTGTDTTLSWLIGHLYLHVRWVPCKRNVQKFVPTRVNGILFFVLSLVLKVRVFGTRIWPIQVFLALKRKSYFLKWLRRC